MIQRGAPWPRGGSEPCGWSLRHLAGGDRAAWFRPAASDTVLALTGLRRYDAQMFDRSTKIGILFAGALVCTRAQWLNHPDSRTPRTRDGKPNLTAPAPRLNGHPDLSGLWQAERTPEREYTSVLGNDFAALQIDLHDINKNMVNVFWGLKPEEEPLRPAGAAAYKRHQENPLTYPHTQCLPDGVPADMFVMTFKMIQAPQQIVLLTELNSPARSIPTGGLCPRIPSLPGWDTRSANGRAIH